MLRGKTSGGKRGAGAHKGRVRTARQPRRRAGPVAFLTRAVRQSAPAGGCGWGGPAAVTQGPECRAQEQTLPRDPGDKEVLKQETDLIRFMHLQGHSSFCVTKAGKPGQRLLENLKAETHEDLSESSCP